MSTRRLLRVLFWNVAVALLLLLPVELFLHLYGPSLYKRTSPRTQVPTGAVWVAPDPDLGWTAARGLHWGIMGEKIAYRINRQGFRHGVDLELVLPHAPTKRRVAVLGDSFTFGIHIEEHETLTAFLGQRLGPDWEVINLGVPGYGIDQMVLTYEKYRQFLKADVVLLVFIDEDIERGFEAFREREALPKPSFDLVRGALVARTVVPETFLDSFLYRSRIANIIYSRWYRPWQSARISETFLHRLAGLVSSDGAQLMVVRYPRLEQVDGRAAYAKLPFHDPLVARGVKFLEPIEALRQSGDPRALYIADDWHPTAAGNRIVAEVIQSFWPR